MSVQISLFITIKEGRVWNVNARYALEEIGRIIEAGGDEIPFRDKGDGTYFDYDLAVFEKTDSR